ncbi:MAG: cation diffusion facilitator family transporter [Mucinivorans sp.]
MQTKDIKIKVQRTILLVGILLLVGKFVAYWLTGSVGILTDALESIVNVLAGILGLWSVWLSSQPRDADHPFGHGKVEMLTASVEGILIIVAGGLIIYEGALRIITPQMPNSLDIGILIIALAGLVNWILGAWSIRVGAKASSIALVSGGKHLQSDTYSTIGLVLGLVLLYVTDIAWIDGALALVFGSIIIVTGIGILRKTARSLMDHSDEVDVERIEQMTNASRREAWIDIHDLRVISYGESIHLDCHLTIPWYYNVRQGHCEGEQLEAMFIEGLQPNQAMVSVHSDPCDERLCPTCTMQNCPERKAEMSHIVPFMIEIMTQDDLQRAERLGPIPN